MPVDVSRIPSHYVTPAHAEARPGWLERMGRAAFERMAEQEARAGGQAPPLEQATAATDAQRSRAAAGATALAALVAFGAGALSAWGSVWAGIATEHLGFWWNWTWIILATAICSLVEFAVLFAVSLLLVARLARLSGVDGRAQDPVYRSDRVSGLLARAALEIDDPVMHVLGIDPLERVSRPRLLLVAILYKLKIAVSNVLARVLLTRLVGRYVLRVSVAYVAVPVTGLWNAWVTVKVARDAQLRLNGQAVVAAVRRQLQARQAEAPLSPRARLAALKAAGNVVVLTQNYHPNMLLLMLALLEVLGEPPAREVPRLDSWPSFLEDLAPLEADERRWVLSLLAIAAALDGHFSALEQQALDEAFGPPSVAYYARIRRLRQCLASGQLAAAAPLVNLDAEGAPL